MAEFELHNAGNSEAQQKEALSRLFTLAGTLAAPGVLDGLVVTQNATPDGNVLIGAGSCVLHPTMTAGCSLLMNDTTKTLNIFTANPVGGLPRNDIVVFDSLTGAIIPIIGTPNATPSDPTVPNTALALARLRHAASAPTIPTAKIDNLIVATTLRGVPAATAPVTGANMGTPASTGTSAATTTSTEVRDTTLGNYVFTAFAGRRYRACLDGATVALGAAADIALVRIRNGGASTPTNASTLISQGTTAPGETATSIALPMGNTFVPGAGTVTLAAFYMRVSGTGNVVLAGQRELYAVDLGPA